MFVFVSLPFQLQLFSSESLDCVCVFVRDQTMANYSLTLSPSRMRWQPILTQPFCFFGGWKGGGGTFLSNSGSQYLPLSFAVLCKIGFLVFQIWLKSGQTEIYLRNRNKYISSFGKISVGLCLRFQNSLLVFQIQGWKLLKLCSVDENGGSLTGHKFCCWPKAYLATKNYRNIF